MTSLISMVKKIVNKKIKQIKSCVMKKIRSNKKVSNNKFSVKATKNIINTFKIAIENHQQLLMLMLLIVANVVTSSKIATKLKVATKPKKVAKPKISVEKNINYNEYKNRIIKQLKKHFKKLIDVKKK